jgi:hypothetical protein
MEPDQDPRWIRLRPSRIALGLSVGGALLAAIAIGVLPLPAALRATLLGAVGLLLLADFHGNHAHHGVESFCLLDSDPRRDGDVGLAIRLRRSRRGLQDVEIEGRVLDGAFVTPWFTSVPYRLPGDRRWRRIWPRLLALWPDRLEADAYRRLRVQLKWK